ncbi:MAG: hypothetical protein EOP24_45840 [Hyphomicrobiales bacterium]|nr:MAG: hypothetical protein EOP24_45840 [Hyphomicrobiales bacterium]
MECPHSQRDKGFGDGVEHSIRVKEDAEIYLPRTDRDSDHRSFAPATSCWTAPATGETNIRDESPGRFIVETLHHP